MKEAPHKSSIQNLDANLIALLVYVIPVVTSILSSRLRLFAWILIPVLALILEKKSEFVKYHAAQALTVALFFVVIEILDGIIGLFGFTIAIAMNAPFLGFMVGGVLGILIAVLAIVIALFSVAVMILVLIVAVKAYNYETMQIPLLSHLVEPILRFRW